MNCPKCNSETVKATGLCIYTYPAYYEYKCDACGYKFEIREEVPQGKPLEMTLQENGVAFVNYIPIIKKENQWK